MRSSEAVKPPVVFGSRSKSPKAQVTALRFFPLAPRFGIKEPMYLDCMPVSARLAVLIGVVQALLVTDRTALATGPGLVLTVGDVDAPGLPLSYLPPELEGAVASAGSVALDPRFSEAEARFVTDPDLAACLELLRAAIAAMRAAPGAAPGLVDALASAAHIAFTAGKPELAEAAIGLLAARAPAATLDVQRYSSDVIEALERERGPLGPILFVSVAAAPGEATPRGCGLEVGIERLGLSVRLPLGPAAVILRCDTERTSLLVPRSGSIVIPAWRLGAVYTNGRVRVTTNARAEQFTAELLAAGTVPWALVLTRDTTGALEARLHRGSRVDRLVGDASDIAGKIDVALAEDAAPFDGVALAATGGPAWWHWGLIGLGATALVVGGVLNGLAADQVESELNAGEDVWDEVEAKEVSFWSLYGAGGALSLTGTILAAIAATGE